MSQKNERICRDIKTEKVQDCNSQANTINRSSYYHSSIECNKRE